MFSFGKKSAESIKKFKADEPKPVSKNSKPPQRIYYNSRFGLKPSESAELIFLDPCMDYSEEEANFLQILGIHPGDFTALEYNYYGKSHKNAKNATWFNNIVAIRQPGGIEMSPSLRMQYFKSLDVWTKIVKHYEGDEVKLMKIAQECDPDEFKSWMSDKEYAYVRDVVECVNGEFWEDEVFGLVNMRNANKEKLITTINWPSIVKFFTVIDTRVEQWRKDRGDEQYQNIVKLLPVKADKEGGFTAIEENLAASGVKRFSGMVSVTDGLCAVYRASRGAEPKSPKTGSLTLRDFKTLEQVQKLNPDAVVVLNKAKIRSILEDDSAFRHFWYKVMTGSTESLDEVVDKFATTLGCAEEDRLVPFAADYNMLCLPKTPTYYRMVFGAQFAQAEGKIEPPV